MRRNICAAAVLLFTITGALFAQVGKDNLAILPFTGGIGDEGEAIAEILSFDANLAARFGIIPRTGIASAVAKEQSFQLTSGMTDADTIAALGAQLGAKYVMAGSITALGSQKVLVVSIVRIETIQQVAGDYLTYNRIEELPAKFSDMMKTLLPLLDVNTSSLPKLAVLPIQMQGGAGDASDATNQRNADTLAQILAIDLLRNKRYAIYPRTSSLEQVQKEFDTQRSGITADKNAAQSGYGVNPEYVLSVASRKLGAMNMFNAAIIDLAEGTMLQGISESYGTLNHGMAAMESIAKTLSDGKMSDFAQVGKDNEVVKDNLAILPFTGGAGEEGDTIAELLSFDANLMARFGIMPRTGIAGAIAKEQGFQLTSGMTDADTIAALGAQLGAKYVMAGSITALGTQKVLVVSIVRIETIQQVAGYYLTYNRIEELPAKFSDMMKTLLPLLDVNTSGLPKLAVLPIQMQGGATNQRDADTLAQILAIDLLRNKSYAIYPRTSSLEKVQEEFQTQRSGVTADKNAAQSGYGVNPEYVLSVTSRKLGEMNMFNAAIIDIAEGTMLQGMSEDYGTLIDGMAAMESIARTLSGGIMSPAEIKQREKEEAERKAAAEREEKARIAAAAKKEKERIAVEQRAAKQAEAARRAAANREKFLQEGKIILGLQGGPSYANDPDEQIFGEPKPTTESSSEPGGNVGLVVALNINNYFAIQSGLNFNIGFTGPSELRYTYLQVPALLRLDFCISGDPSDIGIDIGISGGLAFNVPLSASSSAFGFRGTSVTMAIPMGGIVGGEVSFGNHSGFMLYAAAQYAFDFGETTVRLADGLDGTFKRSSLNTVFGIKFHIPLSR